MHVQIGYQHDCLDMSLASGLDQMQDLKELRRVGLERMAVQFFNAAWPSSGRR